MEQFNQDFLVRLIRGILRPGLGYFFQNLAILINIERWSIILTGGSTASIRDNTFSYKNKDPADNEDE